MSASPRTDESTPILDTMVQPPISYFQLIKSNSLGSPSALIAQAGLLVWLGTLWRVLTRVPFGLFVSHPMANSLAVLAFAEGVLLLQPTKTAAAKKTGLTLHQVFQYTGLPLILLGTSLIIYNKAIHSAPHFASWHGKFGIATLVLILTQIAIGAILVYIPLTKLVGGETKARSLWKYHRMSGYVTLGLLFLTPATAIESAWVVSNTTEMERYVLGAGLAITVVAMMTRINFSKWGFAR